MSSLRKFRFRFGCRVLLGADVPSDGFQAVQHISGTTVACLCLACQVWRVCQAPDLLTQWAIDASCALGRSFHLWFMLALFGLLSRPLGWRFSPIGKPLQQLCIHGTPPCHCLAVCAQAFPMQARYGPRFQRLSSRHRPDVHAWLGSFERCRPCESARQRHTATIGLRACSALRGLLGFLLWSQPVIVWAAPPGLGEALADIEAMVAAMPEVPIAPGNAAPAARSVDQEVQPNLVGPPPDSPGPIQERSWFDIVAEVQQDSLREAGFRDPRHPLAGQVLPVERYVPGLPPHEVPRRFRCHSYVVSPGYVPELSQLTWTLPCETKDAEYLVSKYLRHDTFPFAGLVVAAQPQPSPDFATFLAIPAWVTYSGLSGVVLDLRASTIGRDGPVIGALLSRPTTAAEIRREAGLFSTGPCSILVGSSMEPLRDDEQVFLENGALVRLVRQEFALEAASTLDRLLAMEPFECFQGPFPRVPEARALMLLHRSGRSFFSGRRHEGQAIHTAIMEFVGLPAGSATFHSPSEGCAERVCYRGAMVRGIIALADRTFTEDNPLVVFLDMRPVGAAISFICPHRPWLGYEDIERLLPRPIPSGWRLTVDGGRRRPEHLEIQQRTTLVFGLVSVLDPLDDPPSAPTSPRSDGPGPEENTEEEDPTEDHSQSSTRSRSRSGPGGRGAKVSPSSDRSYHGSFAHGGHGFSVHMGGPLPAVRGSVVTYPGHLVPASPGEGRYGMDSEDLLGVSRPLTCRNSCPAPWPAPVDLRTAVLWGHTPLVTVEPEPVGFILRDFSPVSIVSGPAVEAARFGPVAHRLPDLPSPYNEIDTLTDGVPGLPNFRLPSERLPPQHHIPRFEQPAPETLPEPPDAPFRAVATIFVLEYTPEVVATELFPGISVPDALASFQAARSPDRQRLFDRLLPVRPQPVLHHATLLAFADWHGGIMVLFDCLRYNGTMYAALVAQSMERRSLLSIAGIRPGQAVEVYVPDYPHALQETDIVEMQAGYAIHFVARDSDHFVVTSFRDMLSSSAGWAAQVDPPVLLSKWLYLMGDDEPSFFLVRPDRRLTFRDDIAACLQYDVALLQLFPTVPRVLDFCDYGAWAQHVLIATQFPLSDPVTGTRFGVYLLDLRPLHAGLTWGFARGFTVKAQTLVDRFTRLCPGSHYVSISGARPRHEDDGLYFDFDQGQVLTVEFRVMPDSSSSDPDSSDEDGSGSDGPGPSDRGDPAELPQDSAHIVAQPDRSRSPVGVSAGPEAGRRPGGHSSCRSRTSSSLPGAAFLNGSSVWSRGMWAKGCLQHVLCRDIPWVTSAFLLAGGCCCTLCALCVCVTIAQARTRPCFLVGLCWAGLGRGRGNTSLTLLLAAHIVDHYCPVEAVQLAFPSTSCHPEGRWPRPVPTPCRGGQGAGDMFATVSALESADTAVVVPPCLRDGGSDWSGPIGAPTDQVDLEPPECCTLLQEAAARADCTAFAVAAATLAVLFDAFPLPSLPRRHPISLEHSVPTSAFQQRVLDLYHVLPPVGEWCRPSDLMDWLDSDIRGLSDDVQVPAAKRRWFEQVPFWHPHAGHLAPRRIIVYTDGSATPAETTGDIFPGAWAISVWVEACQDSRKYLLGCAADIMVPPEDPRYVGTVSDTPLECEQVALVWAFAWIVQFGASLHLPVVLRYDCLAAGRGAFGSARAPVGFGQAQPSALSLYLCQLRQIAHSRASISHEHVKAHSGHVANELCDELSKLARRCSSARCGDLLPDWPGQVFRHELKAWAWLPKTGTSDLPALYSFESEAARLQACSLIGSSGPCLGHASDSRTDTAVQIQVCLISFNVLSLLDPASHQCPPGGDGCQGMRVVAKRELLKEQFIAAEALFVGLQETRLREEATLPDRDFIILCAPADARGHFGVSLWVSKNVAYAQQGSQMYRLQSRHLTVTLCSSRMLVVQVCAPHLQATVVVAHAPSEPPAQPGTADRFWRQCSSVLQRRPKNSDVILLTDANARLGSLPSASVGDHCPEEETASGRALHTFVVDHHLWLPATFDACHIGPSHTWWTPGEQGHRLDYVGVPLHWPGASLHTRVWQDFESLQLRDDHAPTVLAASFSRGPVRPASGHHVRRAVRPRPGTCPAHYGSRLEALSMLPVASWGTGVDAHFSGLIAVWGALGTSICEPAQAKAHQTYITGDTLRLIAWRRTCRQRLRELRAQSEQRILTVGLLGWRLALRFGGLPSANVVRILAWARGLLPWIGQAAMLVHRSGKLVKHCARADRVAYLDGLVKGVSLADLRDPKQLFRQVRAAFPQARSSRRASFIPLPAVLDSKGRLAASAEARFECWRQHFASQEAGEPCPDADYCMRLSLQKAASPSSGPVFDIACVPTLTAVEQTLAGLPYGKASGYDGLTGELLRVHVPASARVLVPLFAKASLGLYEPIEWRGGALIPLAKRAAAALSCDRFRSILISSLPGKVYHRQLRSLLMPALQRVRGDTQAGAVPGISTEAISMVARTFRDLMAARRSAWALIFFDVRAAYYRVIRQLLVGAGDAEAAIRRLLHEMGVPAAALGELRDRLAGVGALAEASAPAHLQAILADAMQGTWFRLDFGSILTVTHRGVRPGDSLADILFGFTLSAYLASTEAAVAAADLAEPMPVEGCDPLWPDISPPAHLACGSWADDFVRMTSQQCHSTLTSRVTKVVTVFVEQADALGIELTFAADKTASVLSHLEGQSPPILYDSEGRFLRVRSAVTGKDHRLPVVDVYKHLGGIVTASGTPVPEISYRHALAWSVVRPLRARLFSAVGIPFSTRCHLLRSLAMSKYAFGSAALSLSSGIHRRLWAKHYVALWRTLWRRRQGDHYRHSYAVLSAVGAPTPPLALALARAVLLRQISTHGPDTLLHLLQVHWCECPKRSWLGQVLADIHHVSQYVSAAGTLVETGAPLRFLLEAVQDEPRWWVRQVKSACRQAQKDMAAWCSGTSRAILPGSCEGSRPDVGVDHPFQCLWCGAAFRLRKHLGVHLARAHQIFSPARHLAHGTTCVSCLKCFWTVSRHQQHLRTTDACMWRTCLLVPCHSIGEMRAEEGEDTQRAKQVRSGSWASHRATLPVVPAQGPKPLTASERLDLLDEEADLGLMSRLFYPDPHFLSWVELFLAGRSTEGPRSGTASFWDRRPLPCFT